MGNPAEVQWDSDAPEKRRFAGMRLLGQGLNHSGVAGRIKVVRQTVARWVRQHRLSWAAALKKVERKPRLSASDREPLVKLLLADLRLCDFRGRG